MVVETNFACTKPHGRTKMCRSSVAQLLVAVMTISVASSDDGAWCDDYDDDTVYNASSCSSFDGISCEDYCVGDCKLFCDSDSPLNGTYSCKSYSGAVCAMEVLANLTESCTSWRAYTKEARVPEQTKLSIPTIELDADSSGCDDHVFCAFCEDSYWCLEMFTTLGTMLWGDARTTLTDEGRGPYAMFSLSNMDNLCNAYDLFNRLENNVTASTGDGTGAGQGSGEVLLAADAVPTLFQRSYALNAFGLAGVAAVVVGLVLHRRGQGKPAYRAIATEAAVTSDGFGDGGMW